MMIEDRKLLMIFMLKKKLNRKLKNFKNNYKILILLITNLKVLLHCQQNRQKKLNKNQSKLKSHSKKKLKLKLKNQNKKKLL